MPAEQPEVVTYNAWRNGPWHSLGPEKGPQEGHNYDSVNMQVYKNGSLGPRPCLKEITASNWDVANPAEFTGAILAHENYTYALTGSATDDKFLYVFGSGDTTQDRLKISDGSHGTHALTGTDGFSKQSKPTRYAAAPESLIGTLHSEEIANTSVILAGDGVITSFDGGSPAITAYTASADGTLTDNEYPQNWDPHTLFSWRDRFWCWGDASNANRIHYSEIGESFDWEALSYIDIGADSNKPIIGVWPVLDSLLIAMKDLRWYRFMFTDSPDFGEIRYIGTKRIPDFNVQPASPGESLVYLTRESGVVVVVGDEIDDMTLDYVRVPTDGEDDQPIYFLRGLEAQEQNSVSLPYQVDTVSASPGNNVYKGDRSLDLVNGVWVQSLYWGPASSDQNPSVVDAFRLGTSHFGYLALPDYNSGTYTRVYSRPVTLNRPSNSNDAWASNTEVAEHSDDSDDRFEGRVWLSTYRAPEKSLAAIEKVIIDFDYWRGSGWTNPAFTVKADYVHNGDDQSTLTVGSLDNADLSNSSNYTASSARVVIRPARMPLASQVDISITGIKSVALNEVTVVYAVEGQTPLTSVNVT